jgi:hypothetical protein
VATQNSGCAAFQSAGNVGVTAIIGFAGWSLELERSGGLKSALRRESASRGAGSGCKTLAVSSTMADPEVSPAVAVMGLDVWFCGPLLTPEINISSKGLPSNVQFFSTT